MSDQPTGELHVPADIVEALKAMPESARKNLSLYQVDLLTRPFRQRIATLETAQSDEATEAALTAFAARCEQLEARVSILKAGCASADKLEEEIEALGVRVNDLASQCDELSEERDEQKARADKAEAALDEFRKSTNECADVDIERISRLMSELAAAKNAHEGQIRNTLAFQTERDAAVAERDRLRGAKAREWISVNDQLPPRKTWVFALWGDEPGAVQLSPDGRWRDHPQQVRGLKRPDCWMPVPALATKSEQEVSDGQ